MGNCQAAELATPVVIHHPGSGKVERIYWSVSAQDVMSTNPGHYVAVVVTSPTARNENGLPLKQLRLLRPDATLHLGQVYRLISFEDVLKEFATKKCVKLEKLSKEKQPRRRIKKIPANSSPIPVPVPEVSASSDEAEFEDFPNKSSDVIRGRTTLRTRNYQGGTGHWKPVLQSISEIVGS